jgi:hypothetical protein
MFPKSFLICASLRAMILPLPAQVSPITQISGQYISDYGSNDPASNPLRDDLGVLLDAGTDARGDDDILQFGYFAGVLATADVSLFAVSEWESFTPSTSMGVRHLTTIGDSGKVSGNVGIFTIETLSLDSGDPELSRGGHPLRLGIRFLNDTAIVSSTHFNVVTSQGSAWTLQSPTNPPALPALLSLDDQSDPLFWQSGLGGEFQTILPIPESSSLSLLIFTSLSLGLRRRRQS